MRISIPVSAFVAAVVGFGGTLALIIAAADAVGASREQTASMVTALCLAMAVESLWLSWRTKMPVITAWSTPGAALVGASTGFTINEAIGAFMLVGVMLVATGMLKPLTRLISKIPASVASGMLAGIVVTFAINAVKTIPTDPLLILPLIAAFFVVRLVNPALSVLAVLIGGGLLAFALGRVGTLPALEMSTLILTTPAFSLTSVIGLALPLYLVTMASQNLSGLAVLKAAGYEPEAGPLIAVTGLVSLISAPFNALTTNLAAISAAICTGPEVHPGPCGALEDRAVLRARLSGVRVVRRLAGRGFRSAAAIADPARRRPGPAGGTGKCAGDRPEGRSGAYRCNGDLCRDRIRPDTVRSRRRFLGATGRFDRPCP